MDRRLLIIGEVLISVLVTAMLVGAVRHFGYEMDLAGCLAVLALLKATDAMRQ